MSDLIGILELVGWIVVVIAVASGVTYSVIRLVPGRARKDSSPATAGDGKS
jgi:hypothetical protein